MQETTTCPCCAAQAKFWITARDNRHLSDDEFDYYHCTGCGLVFLDPVPPHLERFYLGGYQPIPASLGALRVIAAKEKYRLEPLLSKKGGDLLEIGPWIGIFSINAKDAGFKVDAIEMSEEASRFLRDQVKINVTTTNDPRGALLASEKRYDVIAMWHSLEHLPRPWEVLEAASRRLKSGGVLLIAIPNIAGAQAELLGKRWMHLDAPRHLYFWSPADLAKIINGFGLKTVELDTDDRLSGALSRMAWEGHFRSMVKIPIIRGVVGLSLAPLANLLTQRKGRGAGLTAVFQAP